jgi:hypothetical protein
MLSMELDGDQLLSDDKKADIANEIARRSRVESTDTTCTKIHEQRNEQYDQGAERRNLNLPYSKRCPAFSTR